MKNEHDIHRNKVRMRMVILVWSCTIFIREKEFLKGRKKIGAVNGSIMQRGSDVDGEGKRKRENIQE